MAEWSAASAYAAIQRSPTVEICVSTIARFRLIEMAMASGGKEGGDLARFPRRVLAPDPQCQHPDLADGGMTGGSAGGNIILASTLKIRDQGLPMPGALYAASPATDLTFADDTCYTLAAVDPMLDSTLLPSLAHAYAGDEDLRNPYISPVYGDYSKPFPPTIISVGTREVLLSNAVREYQAIRSGGHDAVLDVYEGVPHGFPGMLAMTPEGKTSIDRAAAFFDKHLALR